MRFPLLLLLLVLLSRLSAAEPDFPLTEDSKPKADVPKGELVKGSHTAKEGSVFPGTERDYTLYLPRGFDKTKPVPFMVFQDGVIYQAPTVFDNLIAKREIPPLVGIFVKPGVVPAANENALPRFNRSYEYDSITDTYARFLIDELLPEIEQKHGIKFSTDPNDAAISGNSSGGIAAFMVAWHRPDRFRRVFTGVGTYVGIHGADQLLVLIRKFEPKPIKVFLQSGTGDNNLYCGDWWMANQMMERSLTWAGYEVNHAWGEGGHNAKHASQILPEVLRWLWKGWPDNKEVKANAKGESKWKGYEVCEDGDTWQIAAQLDKVLTTDSVGHGVTRQRWTWEDLACDKTGRIYAAEQDSGAIVVVPLSGAPAIFASQLEGIVAVDVAENGDLMCNLQRYVSSDSPPPHVVRIGTDGRTTIKQPAATGDSICMDATGRGYVAINGLIPGDPKTLTFPMTGKYGLPGIASVDGEGRLNRLSSFDLAFAPARLTLSPDQTVLYATNVLQPKVISWQIQPDGTLKHAELFTLLDSEYGKESHPRGLCVDTEGRLYVATALGIQVCDQAGRVNFIIPTPQQPYDVCFGGKDLSELFIACGDKVYKRQTKVHGIVSGQMAPIKPAAPKL